MSNTDPTKSDDRERILRLIRARVPELTEANLQEIGLASPDRDDRLPTSIGDKIMDVLLAMEQRLTALEADRAG